MTSRFSSSVYLEEQLGRVPSLSSKAKKHLYFTSEEVGLDP